MLNTYSANELREWRAYFSIYPFKEDRADMRAGIIASTLANVNRGKGQSAYEPKDFIVEYNKPQIQVISRSKLVGKLSQLKSRLGK